MTSPTGSTNWEQYGLADIWDMLQANPDLSGNFQHVKAWDKMQILCDAQAQSLRALAKAIADRWPPEHSAAAAAFATRLQGLAGIFAQAGQAAVRNALTLNGVTVGFLQAQRKVSDLRDTWAVYQQAQDRRVAIARNASISFPIPTPLTGLMINAVASDDAVLAASNVEPIKTAIELLGAPAVPTGWRDELDRQARAVMTASDKELVEAKGTFAEAPVLKPQETAGAEWPPQRPPAGDAPTGGFFGTGAFTRPSLGLAPGQPGRSPWPEQALPADDPVLDGSPMTSGPGVGGIPTIAPDLPAGGGVIPWVSTPAGAALAPGGVIGQRSPGGPGVVPLGGAGLRSGTAMRSGAAAAASMGGFVAPPGGLIAGRPDSGKKGVGPAANPSGSRRRRRGEDDGWAVPSGVPGVLTPDPEPDEHHPGPGVIGIDR